MKKLLLSITLLLVAALQLSAVNVTIKVNNPGTAKYSVGYYGDYAELTQAETQLQVDEYNSVKIAAADGYLLKSVKSQFGTADEQDVSTDYPPVSVYVYGEAMW